MLHHLRKLGVEILKRVTLLLRVALHPPMAGNAPVKSKLVAISLALLHPPTTVSKAKCLRLNLPLPFLRDPPAVPATCSEETADILWPLSMPRRGNL